ncbi:hypothetical protein ACOI22_02800 [Glaciecola sp. 2405UD65-10]|uniref:hypothetical protein n=1 Tax=Glaciecola sp. 2405UD65-10 TaxID=3397244 RepID=UPI003B5B829B
MHKIKFYPVGNGDTSQIILSNNKRILMDYRQHPSGTDSARPEIDLKESLTTELASANLDFFDVVMFTHADKDHIEGCTEFFYLEHAQKYQSADRIKIKELWVPAAMLLESVTIDERSDEFAILRAEARYRLRTGEGIKIFSKPDSLIQLMQSYDIGMNERDYLFVDAGTIVDTFSLKNDGVEFFCHSPYKKHCDDGARKEIRNESALIFNVRFKKDDLIYDLFASGDSTCEVLADIVNITEYHGNEDRLAWNIYSLPHHCSYLALAPSGEKGKTKTIPTDEVKRLLLSGKPNGYILSSSHPIGRDDAAYESIQPPHVQAKNTYLDIVDEIKGRKFLVTMEEPNNTCPKPTTFEISAYGLSLVKSTVAAATLAAAASPARAGICKNGG